MLEHCARIVGSVFNCKTFMFQRDSIERTDTAPCKMLLYLLAY